MAVNIKRKCIRLRGAHYWGHYCLNFRSHYGTVYFITYCFRYIGPLSGLAQLEPDLNLYYFLLSLCQNVEFKVTIKYITKLQLTHIFWFDLTLLNYIIFASGCWIFQYPYFIIYRLTEHYQRKRHF